MSIGVKAAPAWGEWQGLVVGGTFRLLRYLGGNERSAVFLTERPHGVPTNAAIKLVPVDDRAGEVQLARWEASALLSHPHLIRLFEMGLTQLCGASIAYVLMEYGEEDLSQVDRPLSEIEAVDMLGCTLKALGYLHAKGLAHGHLKPSNILAVSDQLKVSSDTIRATGHVADEGASAAGDIWCLGVTLVEATTKQLPSWETAAAAAYLPDGLPVLFRVPVLNCLRRDPQQRWTVADFVTFLERNAGTSSSPQYGLPGAKGVRRRDLMAAGVVGFTLAAAAIVVPRFTSQRATSPSQVVEPAGVRQEPAEIRPTEDSPPKTIVREPATKAAPQDIVKQVLPDVPAKARNTIRGKVVVNVRADVDGAGSVVDVKNESPASSRYFANLALQAARRWKFAPVNPTASTPSRVWTLRFQFVRDPKHAVSVQAIPDH